MQPVNIQNYSNMVYLWKYGFMLGCDVWCPEIDNQNIKESESGEWYQKTEQT